MAIFGYNYPEDGYGFLERQNVETVLRTSKKIVKEGTVLLNKEFLEEAVHLFVENNRYREALILAGQLLTYSPSDSEIWYQKSLCYVHLHQYHKALKAVKKALLFNPQSLEVLAEQAHIYVHINRYENALKIMDKAIGLYPDDPDVYFQYGRLLGLMSRFDTAIEYFERSISLDPKHSEAYFQLAQSYIELGMDAEVMATYELYLDVAPDCAYGWLNKGIYLESCGKLEDALHCYELSTALDKTLSEAWFNAGNLYADFSFNLEAIDAFKKVLETNPDDTLAMFNIATVFEENGDYKSAIRYFKACLKADPASKTARLGIGYCVYKLKKKGRSLEHFRLALSTTNNMVEAWYRKEVSADECITEREIIKHLVTLSETRALNNTELIQLCNCYERIGKYDDALVISAKLLKKKEVTGKNFYTFSRLQFILGNNVEAIIHLKKAFAFDRELFHHFRSLFPEVVSSKLFKELFRFSGLVEPPTDERYYG